VRPSAGFLLRFFAFAAGLFALWSFGGLGDLYARAVLLVSNPLMWLLSGFQVSKIIPTGSGVDVMIRRGADEGLMPLQPREMFSGLIPFLALVGASTGLTMRQRLRALGIGVAILFVFHMGLALVGPYMTGVPQASLGQLWMRRVNKLIDIFYGFYGLVGYAALPFLLWWWLAYRPATSAPQSP